MKSVTFSKPDLPFLFGGNGSLTVNANVDSITQPLSPSDQDVLSLQFGAQGNTSFSFGAQDDMKLGIQVGAKNRLYGLWPSSSSDRLAILADHGLADFFSSHPDQMILVLTLDGNAAAQLAGSFTYAPLTITTTLDAGGNAGYMYLHSFASTTPSDKLFLDFLRGLRLPSSLSSAIPVGEVIAFEYGGYLKLGASLAVGYQLMGAPNFSIGQLQLSEHYKFSVAGSLDLGAQIAGQFAVEARAAVDEHGLAKPDWVRIIVRKNRSSSFHIAADAGITTSFDLQGLPDSADEFLGALLGIRAKNWLNMINRVRELSDLDALKAELDDLGKSFIETWIGKAFDELSNTEFADFLERVQKVVDSYENLDNSAITLFDRYFGKLDFLTAQLDKLSALTSWDNLKGQVDGDLWQVVQQLTDGDPLTWILGEIEKKDKNGNLTPIPSLPELKARVTQTLDLIKSTAHDEIRKVIGIAKEHFPLDHFVQELSKVDSIPSLKALADEKAVGFFERLLGTAVDQIKNSEAGQIFKRLHTALNSVKEFEDNAYSKFKDAVHQSFTFNLHAEYNRSSDSDALVDVEINTSTAAGQLLLHFAGRGDFQKVLSSYNPDIVRLNEGTLTHNVTKSSSLSVNIFGWHDGWHYKGLDTVIAKTDQHIVTGKDNSLRIYSTISLEEDNVRERQDETTTTNLIFRFLGESQGALVPDKKSNEFFIDAITGGAITYSLGFTDKKTSQQRLDYFLSFAESFGLTAVGATTQSLLPLLPKPDLKKDDYGPMTVNYEVRYTEKGLKALAAASWNEHDLRLSLRRIVLASYLAKPELTEMGWCYWTDGIYRNWANGPAAFTNHLTNMRFSPISGSPFSQFPTPPEAILTPTQLKTLSTLFFIEDRFVKGLLSLASMINEKRSISPSQFEHNLLELGDALKDVNSFDESVNGLFAFFDQLIRKQTPEAQARISSLTLTSQVGGKDVTKVFLSGGVQQADPAPVVAPTPVVPKGKAAGAPGGGN